MPPGQSLVVDCFVPDKQINNCHHRTKSDQLSVVHFQIIIFKLDRETPYHLIKSLHGAGAVDVPKKNISFSIPDVN